MSKQKYYVVWKGKRTGVYQTWEECKEQIQDFKGALYKSFSTLAEAEQALKDPPHHHLNKGISSSPEKRPFFRPVMDSLSVDAACSGNPGIMEYRGVYTADRREIFHCKFEMGTNNIGEFLALVHGLSYLKKHGLSNPIYTDSVNAMSWVKARKAKTKLERNESTESLFLYIERAEKWLQDNKYDTSILKWNTELWGEIPADFGRK